MLSPSSVFNHLFQRELADSICVLNFCIQDDIPETAREVGRWIAVIGFELDPTLRDNPKMSLWPKPFILSNYQEHIR